MKINELTEGFFSNDEDNEDGLPVIKRSKAGFMPYFIDNKNEIYGLFVIQPSVKLNGYKRVSKFKR